MSLLARGDYRSRDLVNARQPSTSMLTVTKPTAKWPHSLMWRPVSSAHRMMAMVNSNAIPVASMPPTRKPSSSRQKAMRPSPPNTSGR